MKLPNLETARAYVKKHALTIGIAGAAIVIVAVVLLWR